MYQKNNDELFSLESFEHGQIVTLTINSNKYLLLTNDVLVNVATGQISRDIKILFDNVKAVYTNGMQQIAIKIENKLYRYDPFKHDENLATLKRLNKLLTSKEVEEKLRDEKLFLDVNKLIYRKARARTKLFECGVTKTFKTEYAQETLKRRSNIYKRVDKDNFKSYIDSKMVPLNCMIERITINEKENLYLYRYQLSPVIF